MNYQTFFLSKAGNTSEEYEDAFAGDVERGRFAIADGATESSFAGSWAKLLVQNFIEAENEQKGSWESWLPQVQRKWVADVGGRSLPWYAQVKFAQGAFATFLGMVVEAVPCGNLWYAIAVGDSCLFQVRDNSLILKFPLTHSEQFGTSPWLIGSREPAKGIAEKKECLVSSHWQPGDRFWLMTDALAQWFMQQNEAGKNPCLVVDHMLFEQTGNDIFCDWIAKLRATREIRNDDVTLLAIDL